ncbi:IS3 family transposase [Methyloversatilis sp. XJ19-49]|uniref:IS3 family transposase n=1 Tax=Methyloversatilis sp. XJ19-49 TaxID=2963429 RepID=UPI00211C8FF4|nr:IS3 family transposase [Methyloversatilis sp. XJ19-49]MCQ9377869.1 IS3 family transposase [Methyloversatilis sp. XJ19-49]
MPPYRAMLAQRGVTQGMSRDGNCFDNVAIEGFFRTLKAECFHLAVPDSLEALDAGVHDCVRKQNHGCITLRLNGFSTLGYRLRNIT